MKTCYFSKRERNLYYELRSLDKKHSHFISPSSSILMPITKTVKKIKSSYRIDYVYMVECLKRFRLVKTVQP